MSTAKLFEKGHSYFEPAKKAKPLCSACGIRSRAKGSKWCEECKEEQRREKVKEE